jgi:hypothetical protein
MGKKWLALLYPVVAGTSMLGSDQPVNRLTDKAAPRAQGRASSAW